MLRALLPGFFQCDLDVQDQFLNFKLHKLLRKYSGMDVQEVRSLAPEDTEWEASRPKGWEQWERNWMGLRDSPYRNLQWQVRLKLEVYGDRRAPSNPFHWDRVEFNLPGSKGYWSYLPWIMKIRADGFLAAEIFVYVDDCWAVAHLADLVWRAARAYAAMCARMGIQDASRKCTSATQMPGPWAGMVMHTDGNQVCGMVSKEKWEKMKSFIRELAEMLKRDCLPLQRLLLIQGFLIYVVRTYTWLKPYIKDFHLRIDSWQPGRGESGYKLRGKELERAMVAWVDDRGMPCCQGLDGLDEEGEPPTDAGGENAHPEDKVPGEVLPVPRFYQDVDCLLELTNLQEPPRQLYRAKHVLAFFFIGDASGLGKGVAVVEHCGVEYKSGPWKMQWRKESSNVREAKNLTDHVKRLAKEKLLF
jgi:hypothetical protein